MAMDKLSETFLQNCEIYYGDALISKEDILSEYANFFAKALNKEKRSVSFALHTGSVCFDFIAVVIATLGCLTYNITSNDDIIANLKKGDMVIYRNKRYRWVTDSYCANGENYLVMEQDGIGKNGNPRTCIPQKYKHLIKPYYGKAQTTDGRGVKKRFSEREEFLSQVFDVPIEKIPSVMEISVVIVANKQDFYEMYKNIRIQYNGNKQVRLMDIVPATYYTKGGEAYQYGGNLMKSEPVLKVTCKISTARELVLQKNTSRVVGLLVTQLDSLTENSSEIADLLRRKSLSFVHVTAPIKAEMGEHILDMYEEAEIFACTKSFLASRSNETKNENSYTLELHRQISNIENHKINKIIVRGGWNWEEYKQVKDMLFIIRKSDIADEVRDEFLLTAYGLINLFNTAFFPLDKLEYAIEHGMVNSTVMSPLRRISVLRELTEKAGIMGESCRFVTDTIEKKYKDLLRHSPKRDQIRLYLINHRYERIAIVIPKAYYKDIFNMIIENDLRKNVTCITLGRFDTNDEYDAVLAVGDISGKKFDPLQCKTVQNVAVLLYECEIKTFNYRRKKQESFERRLDEKMKRNEGYVTEKTPADLKSESIPELDSNYVEEESDLDSYIENIGMLDLRKLMVTTTSSDNNTTTSEVRHIGKFTTGEQILFSKNYDAVVYDSEKGTVTETKVEKLSPGDILVFTKRDNYTKNIVDDIFEKLIYSGILSKDIIIASRKANLWKDALREYKEREDLTYRELSNRLKALGSSIKEVGIRHWLMEDSHVVGPRKIETMEAIARLTNNPELLSDVTGCFEACRIVRHERRYILGLIEKAINEKLSGRVSHEDSIIKVVYDNVDKLSEMHELEYISELEETASVSSNLVNRPLTEAEVLL